MFEKVNVPLIGVIENMSHYVDPTSGNPVYLFGKGGGEMAAQALNTDFLGRIPLEPNIRENADMGIPLVLDQPDNPASKAIYQAAGRIINYLYKQT